MARNNVTIEPNPVSGIFKMQIFSENEGNVKIQIYDLNGKTQAIIPVTV